MRGEPGHADEEGVHEMKRWGRFAALAMCLALAIPVLTGVRGQAQGQSYSQIALIKIPGVPPATGAFSYDIGWVDPGTHRYFLADRTNNGIDVIDTTSNRYLYTMAQRQFVGFTGKPATSGPDGILIVPDTQIAWVGDGRSRVKAVSVRSGLVLATISTGTTANRADELAYDPVDHLIAIANNEDDPPYLTFISTTERKAVGKLTFPDATDGLEQPAYDPTTGMFFLSVPETKASHGGAIARIDPKTMKLVAMHPVTACNPTGLVAGPQQRLLVGCGAITAGAHAQSLVMDAKDGHIVAAITQVGAEDQVWYNPGDNRYYLAARNMTATGMKGGLVTPVLGIVDASTNQWIANVPTGAGAHSVAVDPTTNRAYVPVPTGIAVISR